MTPSINRLHDSSKALGDYFREYEYDLVREEFAHTDINTFSQFTAWITGYMYYHTVVCACSGDEQNINIELERDYDELMAVAGRQAG